MASLFSRQNSHAFARYGAIIALAAGLALPWGSTAADEPTCLTRLRALFQEVQKVHPTLSFDQLVKQSSFALFDTKISEDLLLRRLQEIYKTDERKKLFDGIPVLVKSPAGRSGETEKQISAHLSTFWLNEVLLLDPARDVILGHPLVTIHPLLDNFIQDAYRNEKLFKKLPAGTMKRVSIEDTGIHPLDSGWVVLSDEDKIIAAGRVFLPDYERAIEWGIPPPRDRWMLPIELEKPEAGSAFLSPEHARILNAQTSMKPQINEALTAEKEKAGYRRVWDGFAQRLTTVHRENQVAEIGRLAKSADFKQYDVMPQITYGIWRLMTQKQVPRAYFSALSPVHRRLYEAEFFSPWKETGVVYESAASEAKSAEAVFGIDAKQLQRYLRQKALEGKLTPDQAQRVLND